MFTYYEVKVQLNKNKKQEQKQETFCETYWIEPDPFSSKLSNVAWRELSVNRLVVWSASSATTSPAFCKVSWISSNVITPE